MRTIKATFENGDFIITKINGTEEDIKKWYLGNMFNLGVVRDNMQKCIAVEFIE